MIVIKKLFVNKANLIQSAERRHEIVMEWIMDGRKGRGSAPTWLYCLGAPEFLVTPLLPCRYFICHWSEMLLQRMDWPHNMNILATLFVFLICSS